MDEINNWQRISVKCSGSRISDFREGPRAPEELMGSEGLETRVINVVERESSPRDNLF